MHNRTINNKEMAITPTPKDDIFFDPILLVATILKYHLLRNYLSRKLYTAATYPLLRHKQPLLVKKQPIAVGPLYIALNCIVLNVNKRRAYHLQRCKAYT